MIRTMLARLKQGYRTTTLPAPAAAMPDRFRGLPVIDASMCPDACQSCVESCPTQAIAADGGKVRIDLGRCLFCNDCTEACPADAIRYTQDYRLATRTRDDLVLTQQSIRLAETLDAKARQLFGRSLKLREISAGGCNACEAELNVLSTIVFDLGRFGIQFVASPRHADGLVVTGPVSENMRTALFETYAAMPSPKLVIAVGACAISGGPYVDFPDVHNGVSAMLPVDLYIPGCPPHPFTILDGLLRLLGRLEPDKH